MKRKVKSASDLKRLALQTGASVEMGGGRFNTSMERAQRALAVIRRRYGPAILYRD